MRSWSSMVASSNNCGMRVQLSTIDVVKEIDSEGGMIGRVRMCVKEMKGCMRMCVRGCTIMCVC